VRQSRNKPGHFRVEQLEDRLALSGVTPAAGQEFGTSTIGLVRTLQDQGTNIGQYLCSQEKGDCAADSLSALNPPGQR
jgi:hypothetical protein